eukprot:4579193-Pleurochrysis_carterae.AAC.1
MRLSFQTETLTLASSFVCSGLKGGRRQPTCLARRRVKSQSRLWRFQAELAQIVHLAVEMMHLDALYARAPCVSERQGARRRDRDCTWAAIGQVCPQSDRPLQVVRVKRQRSPPRLPAPLPALSPSPHRCACAHARPPPAFRGACACARACAVCRSGKHAHAHAHVRAHARTCASAHLCICTRLR